MTDQLPSAVPADDSIEPFRIEVPEEVLDDLVRRLADTRWADDETVDDWSQGIPAAYLRDVCEYWRTGYDWRAREERLNEHDQFRTVIDGLGIHFIHQRSPHPGARPLLLTHGWPGSVVEFHQVIGPLTDPTAHGGSADDAFHVVAPSLPGYGFSDRPREPGWGIERIAETWVELMRRLGYPTFFAQGGDWGAMVTTTLAQRHRDAIDGIHLNMAIAAPTHDDLTEDETRVLEGFSNHSRWESGYSKQQSSRPQTLAYGLVDSPVFQAAWILEKFRAWTDCDGHPENALTRDEMLDDVMLYWVTATGGSSARLYWESFHDTNLDEVSAPSGISVFPHEIFRPSRRWAEGRFTDLRHWGELDRGGHFAAFEQPELFVDELRACFGTMR